MVVSFGAGARNPRQNCGSSSVAKERTDHNHNITLLSFGAGRNGTESRVPVGIERKSGNRTSSVWRLKHLNGCPVSLGQGVGYHSQR
jgi:hypothetical protein